MNRGILLLFISGLLIAMPASSDEIYQWTDENGVKHYTGHPPPPTVANVASRPEIPHDSEADLLRMEKEAAELEAIIEKMAEEQRYRELEQKLRETEKKLEAVEKQAQEAAEKAAASMKAAEEKERRRFWYPIAPYPRPHPAPHLNNVKRIP